MQGDKARDVAFAYHTQSLSRRGAADILKMRDLFLAQMQQPAAVVDYTGHAAGRTTPAMRNGTEQAQLPGQYSAPTRPAAGVHSAALEESEEPQD